MAGKLKILLLEDSRSDATIVQRLLCKETKDTEFRLTMSREEFYLAMEDFEPTIVLADNSLPQFDAREALQIVRQRSLYIPFIMVTGTVSEEFAADIIKSGADDYVLKDRLARLPAAIKAAIHKQKVEKEKQVALEEIKRSNERFQTLSKVTKDAVWDWNLQTNEYWWNDNFFDLLGYDSASQVPGAVDWSYSVHPQDRDKIMSRLRHIREQPVNSWEDEFRVRLSNGDYGTVLGRTYVLKDEEGQPVRAIGALVDITEQKRLVGEMEALSLKAIADKVERQRDITRIILQSQEMERNKLGRELHDNINQILVSVKLRLGLFLEDPARHPGMIEECKDTLEMAIMEARNLSHHMVMPRFSERSLKGELELLIENYSFSRKVELELRNMNETELSSPIKETLFRIAQEQLSNIVKHAKAGKILMRVYNDPRSVNMVIRDNGIGFDLQQKRKGIGITNILNRVESYNGRADFISEPGQGCTLSVSIPFQLRE